MLISHPGSYSGLGRPTYGLPYRPSTKQLTKPLAPRNILVTSPYQIGKTDIRWDNPKIIPDNSGLNILGCNVYRSTDHQFGLYEKINTDPIGVLFYRDETKEAYVQNEIATPTLLPGTNPDGQWVIYSQFKPIIIPGTNGVPTTLVKDIKVEIDNGDGIFLETPAYSIDGVSGEIVLISSPVYQTDVEQIIPPRLPIPPNGRVRISYNYLQHSVMSVLNQRIFYKVTTVAVDPDNPSATIETPLDEIESMSPFDIEVIDYIWKEAIRRNGWILEQGGERVMIYTRKWMGVVCKDYEYDYGQAHNDCRECLGTGIVGGFDGPYRAIIAPPETEKTVELGDMGLRVRYDWSTWMLNYPMINQRDVIIRQNNERYIVGPVNYQGQRGAIFQQHFTMSYLDEGDIRYKIDVHGGETSVPESTDAYREEFKSEASPVINAKPSISPDRIVRGRSVTFENITY